MPSLHIEKLPIPQWARTNGVGTHIARINKLLPGYITVLRDYVNDLEVSTNTRANYCIGLKSACTEYFGERFYVDSSLREAINLFFRLITPKRDRHINATFLTELLIRELMEGAGLRTSLWIQNL